MRKSSVGSATGIDNGCVIAFPREKTIAIRGSTSSTSLPEVPANPSAVSSLRLDRNRLGMAYKQADQGLEQDADLRNFAVQNLIVQQFQVGQSKSGQRSARLPLSSSAVMDHAVAGSQMVPDRQSRSSPAHSAATASPEGGSDKLRKAAAARLVAVAQSDPGQSGFGQGPMGHSERDSSKEGAAIADPSRTADVSSYIAHMTQELAQMARASNLDLLAYFLEMAELEARMRNGSSLQSA